LLALRASDGLWPILQGSEGGGIVTWARLLDPVAILEKYKAGTKITNILVYWKYYKYSVFCDLSVHSALIFIKICTLKIYFYNISKHQQDYNTRLFLQ
jgi:hypothetical protein